ncbi:MAG: prepilin peptidase [Pseudomonadota bacterium]
MESAPFVQALILSAFPFLLAFAGVSDLITMTISNRISILLVATFLILALALGLPLEKIAWHVAAGALVLAIGFAMFAVGWIGGGDAKLAAAISLWFGIELTFEFAVVSAFFGGLLTLFIVLARQRHLAIFVHKIEWLERFLSGRKGVPYGIALSAGALMLYPQTIWVASLVQSVGSGFQP